LLADGGYNVVSAGGYDEALACLGVDTQPDVLVTDVRLGGPHDGIELAREAARRRPGLRIVIVSGEVRPPSGDYPGRAIFFTKPYAPGALLAIVADGEAWETVAAAQPSAASVVTPA
jgi:DNA-binding NtrC family response regulator